MPNSILSKVVNEISKHIGKTLSYKITESLSDNIIKEIKTNLKTGPGNLKSVFIEQFDLLISIEDNNSGSEMKGKDPTSLKNIRGKFIQYVDTVIDNATLKGDNVEIEFGDLSLFGLDGSISGDFFMLGYWINGIIGQFAFLPIKLYGIGSSNIKKGGGRYGAGFMIDKQSYEDEKWSSRIGVSFEQLRHPLSGQPPFSGFNKAAESINWQDIISKSVATAIKKTFS